MTRRNGCEHRAVPIIIGTHTVFAGGTYYLERGDLNGIDVIVPLTNVGGKALAQLRKRHQLIDMALPDFGGVPSNWKDRLEAEIIPLLASGKSLCAFCVASHGRTGTFLASLIALLEPQTTDPIAAVRARHCRRAVESRAQAEAIFALRGKALPKRYRVEFAPRPSQPKTTT